MRDRMVRHTEPWRVEECWSQTWGDVYYIEGEQNAQRVGNRLLIANALDLALALRRIARTPRHMQRRTHQRICVRLRESASGRSLDSIGGT